MVDCRRMDIDCRTRLVDVSQLCRLCAVQDEHVVPIFEGHGLDLEFEVKLEKYLSLKVSKNDVLPLRLCLKCSNTLMSWHELVVGCKEAEKRLLSLLSVEENRFDCDSDVILLDENSQDSVSIIENDTSGVQLGAQSYDSEKLGDLTPDPVALSAALQGQQSSFGYAGSTVTVFTNAAKSQDCRRLQLPGQVVIGQAQPTSTGETVQLSKSQRRGNAVTTQSNVGALAVRQSPPRSARDPLLTSQVTGNVKEVQSVIEPNAAQTKPSQSISTSGLKNRVIDKQVMVSGRRFKTIVKPFLLSRFEKSIVAKPITSTPAPPQENTNVITLLIPGIVPPNSQPVLSTDSNTPILTLPVILPQRPTSNQLPSVSESAVVSLENSNPEFRLQDAPNFNLDVATNLMSDGVDNDSRGTSPCSSDFLLPSSLENEQEGTGSGDSAGSKIPQNVKGPEMDENESDGAELIYVISHEDHRYSKSSKVYQDSATKQRNKDRAISRKRLIKALNRRIKSKGCFICGKIIHNRTLRFAHERSHFKTLEYLSYNCTLCGESFKTFEEMVLHRKKHRKREREKTKTKATTSDQPAGPSAAGDTATSGEDKNLSEGSKNLPILVKKEVSPRIKCVICSLFFNNKVELSDHKQSSHTEEERANPYACPTCGKRFASNSSIHSHLKIHTEGPGELCPHCGKVFKLKSTLNQHVRKMHNVPNPWPKLLCEYCPRKFDSRAKLLSHLNCHTGERPFACSKCDKAFHSPSNLRQHLACHEDARPCMCHICGKTFKWPKNLKQHTVTHVSKHLRPKTSKQNPVQCDLCGKKLNGVGSLKTHKYRFHRDVFFLENPSIQRLPCNICSRVFSSNINLDLHMKRFHADGQQRFTCDVCGKRFTTKVGRNDHLRLHTGERPYACNLCDKTFTCASNLCAHKDAHSEARPHQCQYCDKQFKRKAHLDCHIRSHTGEKPYVCDVCNRGFAQSNDMRKHRGTHFDGKPFECSFCESTFKKKKELIRHLAKHCVSERQEDDSDEIDYSTILQSDNAIVAYEVC